MSTANNAPSAGSNPNMQWVAGEIQGLIVGSDPSVHYQVLFLPQGGSYVWANIDPALYDIASTAYKGTKSAQIQGDLNPDNATIISILLN